MTPEEATRFVEQHGVVLESAHGPVPNLVEAVLGERIRGSWWAHKKGRDVFRLTRAVRDSPDVLVCRLVDGKITYVHRRLWPALARLHDRLPAQRLAAVHEIHTGSGKHRVEETPFRTCVPPELWKQAENLSETDALSQLGDWARALTRPSAQVLAVPSPSSRGRP